MVKTIKTLFQTQVKGLHQAAYLLGFFALLSQIFALIRDRLLASTFGAGLELDMYYAAFRIPDIIFVIMGAVFAMSVLVPKIIEKQHNDDELNRYFNSIFSFVCIFALVLFVIAWFLTPYFLKLIVPSIFENNSNEMINMTRILLLQPLILSLSGFFGSFAQAQKKFLVYAFSPVFYNFAIIIGIVFLYPVFGLYGLIFGVILGAFLHLGILLPFTTTNYKPKISKIYFSDIKMLIFHSIPRTFAMMSNQILLVFVTFFAGLMATGSIAIFNLAYNLQSVPLAIIGVSYSLAAFPSLALFYNQNKNKEFYELLSNTIRHVFFWSIPVVVLFIVLRAQIVRVILGSGNFDWNETILVAAALALFTLSLIAQTLTQVLVRAFYAMNNTLYPFFATLLSFVVTLLFMSIVLVPGIISSDIVLYFETFLKVDLVSSSLILILPLAFTIGQWVQFFALVVFIGNFSKIFSKTFFVSISQSFASAIIVAVISYLSLNFFSGIFDLNTFLGIFAQGLLSGIFGLLSGLVFLIIIGNKEVSTILHTSIKKIKQLSILQPEIKEEL
jgi:putative peptidoglycan lipid II flippase